MEGVVRLENALVWLRGSGINLSRAFHSQRLVRALLVEFLLEMVKPGLLLEEVGTRRARGLLLQGQVHAFVPAVLLGMAGLDPFDADAQAEPPHRKLG